jgi:hypothetical protein
MILELRLNRVYQSSRFWFRETVIIANVSAHNPAAIAKEANPAEGSVIDDPIEMIPQSMAD